MSQPKTTTKEPKTKRVFNLRRETLHQMAVRTGLRGGCKGGPTCGSDATRAAI